ncbi:MAG: ABC transporter ATP-binding protein [Emcibacteraceae bacterium]|nr:ABC transporter ATP-binding protein [Emcibacteraceae bacterium]
MLLLTRKRHYCSAVTRRHYFEGRISQFEKTSTVYHHPRDATTARVFSNPPMNFLKLNKKADKITFGDGTSISATDNFRSLDDGDYIAGFRPNHLELSKHSDAAIHFSAHLNVTEITGSETYLHLEHDNERWVGLVHGIHDLALDKDISVYLDPSHIYTFAQDGDLILSAAYAKGAMNG